MKRGVGQTAKSDRGEVGINPVETGQAAVLALSPSARVLVDAGPGTGKTYVACQRVAHLIRQGIPATRIWIISFTRTAVREIRDRIAAVLDAPEDAMSVHIATLDSHAWALQSGFDAKATLKGSFEEGIAATIARIREDDLLREELERTRHLVIDEAQDIVGVRAELTRAIIEALDERCGVTAFADEAQAIYGFSEENNDGEPAGTSLADSLRAMGFGAISLAEVHRTNSPQLREIFTGLRKTILGWQRDAEELDRHARNELVRLAHSDAGQQRDLKVDSLAAGTLLLLRRRIDVLAAANWAATPYRLRMSGLPACVHPWVSHLLWDQVERRLTRTSFLDLWAARIGDAGADAAWHLLIETAGETAATIDLIRLRNVLSRLAPPIVFCSPEFGTSGPVLSTIHASKGREADEVVLYLPKETTFEAQTDPLEEIRVLFVGATRARVSLSVGEGSGRGGMSHEGRVWRQSKGGIQIQVGQAGDVTADGLVGRRSFTTEAAAQAAQAAWAADPVRFGLPATPIPECDYRFALQSEGLRLAVLSGSLNEDLKRISNKCKAWPPPNYLPHLRSLGLRSLVLREDDPALDELHEPWRSSGFMLAPLLTGLPSTKFPRRNQ